MGNKFYFYATIFYCFGPPTWPTCTHSIWEKFKEELKRLEGLKVIASVEEPTEWVSQIAVAVKKSGELRLCIDPKPLNVALKREHYQIPVIDDLLPDLTDASGGSLKSI